MINPRNLLKMTVLSVLVVVAYDLAVTGSFGPEETGAARDAARLATKICDPCAGSATTTYAGRQVNGGYSIFQVTCSTAGGNTWPDAFDLEARDADDHTWVSVQGYTTAVADAREENLLGFAEGAQVRAVVTDAAGQHSCFATLAAFGGK